MSRQTWVLCLSFLLTGCGLFHRVPRPAHAPPEEAAKVTFPFPLPTEGEVRLEGNRVAAIQLAMDHFLPLGIQLPPEDFRFKNACELQRESYDAITTPGPEGVMLVRFVVNQAACPLTNSGVNMATGQTDVDVFTYAIDIRTWRIISIDFEPMRQVGSVPEQKE